MDQETTALEWNLEKLKEDPSSIEKVRKIIQACAKSFTVFKEENRQLIFDIYQKFNFHEMIFGVQKVAKIGVEEGYAFHIKTQISERGKEIGFNPYRLQKMKKGLIIFFRENKISGSSQKRDALKVADDEIVTKRSKKNSDESSKDRNEMLPVRYPNFEFQCDNNGAPKQKIIIFTSSDKKMCHVFENTEDEFQCPRCNKTAEYVINQYGERYIKIPKLHSCESIPYEPEVEHSGAGFIPNYQLWEFLIFTPSKNAFYRFKEARENSSIIYCVDCHKKETKIVNADFIEEEDGRITIQIHDDDHVCVPQEYRMPKKIVQM